ncbi:MAG TPA: MATE family efflux transporter [Candidatus Stercoripulliclostridium merdigallinarum]|uniref:MATE family efflux transporter n=1 Tax=Candidatus Stercoripulliclostridium merdigallinarum TaxID=2840951 RepID=A0A9D1MH04_9FIRM|nr:MATE family efflux transporter [Candidatus Stercoripulliclostridium merdigallinarum]
MVKDLTQGKPLKVLLIFCIPLLISSIFQQLYNMVDSIIAGKVLGEAALAAVGASYPITMIFTAIALGCNLGCSVIISKLFGERNYTDMKSGVNTILISVAVLGVLLTGIGIGLGSPIMRLLKTPNDIMADSLVYLYIYIGGFLFVLMYNVATGIFSALGDSRTPLYFLVSSSLVNIGLDLLFTMVIPMGVAGLAWATFITQGIAGVLCIVTLIFRLRKIKGEGKPVWFSPLLLKQMLYVAIPSVLQQSFVSVGNLVIQSIINGYGSSVLAGYIAAVKLNTFVITTITTVAGGLSAFAAQNLGAGKIRRVLHGSGIALLMAMVFIIPFSILFSVIPETMLKLFLEESSALSVSTGTRFLIIVSPFYAVISVKLMLDSVLRGAQSMLSFMVATFADLLIRVIMCYILDPVLGVEGIWWSWPIGWVAATLISVGLFAPGKWYKSLRAQHLFPALQKDNATADTNEREAETKTE